MALDEDVGPCDDVTTEGLYQLSRSARAVIRATVSPASRGAAAAGRAAATARELLLALALGEHAQPIGRPAPDPYADVEQSGSVGEPDERTGAAKKPHEQQQPDQASAAMIPPTAMNNARTA